MHTSMFMRKWHVTTIMCHYFRDDVRLCEGLQFHWITQDLLLWGSGLERLRCALLAASFHNIYWLHGMHSTQVLLAQ